MWESRGADEPITTNFSSLVFYEERLLHRVYEEVEAFLSTPATDLLASGLPLKLGFPFRNKEQLKEKFGPGERSVLQMLLGANNKNRHFT